jgi:quinoprotein glucose dehydrogenase
MKKLLIISSVVVLVGLLPFLGGSMIWYLGGAHGLDIDGVATKIDRPQSTIDVGGDWRSYGADVGGHRFSSLAEITPKNVKSLEVAWDYSTGDLAARPDQILHSATEGTPILVEDSLIFCTPFNEVIALNPGTGSERWRFDPEIDS